MCTQTPYHYLPPKIYPALDKSPWFHKSGWVASRCDCLIFLSTPRHTQELGLPQLACKGSVGLCPLILIKQCPWYNRHSFYGQSILSCPLTLGLTMWLAWLMEYQKASYNQWLKGTWTIGLAFLFLCCSRRKSFVREVTASLVWVLSKQPSPETAN